MASRLRLSALLRDASGRLERIGAGNPLLEAQHLLAFALGVTRVTLLRMSDADAISDAGAARFEDLMRRRLSREPLQYILGTVPFCDLDLLIGPGCLIPRGETEILVERASQALLAHPAEIPKRVVDVGTGSGAILLAMLRRMRDWHGVGTDTSSAALDWACRNRERARLEERADLLQCNLLCDITDRSAGAVVSNPPYIPSGEFLFLAPEIRNHEPWEALDGGVDGLRCVRCLIPEVGRALVPGGLLALELAPDQPGIVAGILEESGRFREISIHDDLAGRPRVLLARRKSS